METDCQAMDLATNKSLWDAYADQFKSELRQGNFASASRTLESALSDAEEFRHIDPVLIWCVNVSGARSTFLNCEEFSCLMDCV
jgi:hypothetical protein